MPISNAQKALAGFAAGLIPAVFGLALPGGLVAKSVGLDLGSIFLATVPWTLSIALITFLMLRGAIKDDARGLLAGAAILAVVAIIGVGAAPRTEVTTSQAAEVQNVWVAKNQPTIERVGVAASHSPKISFFAAVVGVVVFIVWAYSALYGLWLWLAGIACGVYLGHLAYTASRGD
jgi:hypothetical protein